MKIFSQIVTGSRHEENGLTCQDVIATKTEGSKQVIVLADGVGHNNLSVACFQGAVEKVSLLMINQFEKLWEQDPSDTKADILLTARRVSEIYEESNLIKREDLGHTLLALAVDWEADQLMYYHLGDGYILSNTEVLSYPKNGFGLNQTYLTTSVNSAFKNSKLTRMSFRDYWQEEGELKYLALLSDGCYSSLGWQSKSPEKIMKQKIRSVMTGTPLGKEEDDQAIIVLKK